MITAEKYALPKTEDLELRKWMGQSGAHILLKIIAARQNEYLVQHLKSITESVQFPAKIDAASAEAQQAARYGIFLEIWNSLIDQPMELPFEIIKLESK